jgi:hypothetical protein
MLALPVCGLVVSCDIDVFGSVDAHPHNTGVFPPQPPCSKPGLGTTLLDASAAAGKISTTAAAARASEKVILGLLLIGGPPFLVLEAGARDGDGRLAVADLVELDDF